MAATRKPYSKNVASSVAQGAQVDALSDIVDMLETMETQGESNQASIASKLDNILAKLTIIADTGIRVRVVTTL